MIRSRCIRCRGDKASSFTSERARRSFQASMGVSCEPNSVWKPPRRYSRRESPSAELTLVGMNAPPRTCGVFCLTVWRGASRDRTPFEAQFTLWFLSPQHGLISAPARVGLALARYEGVIRIRNAWSCVSGLYPLDL